MPSAGFRALNAPSYGCRTRSGTTQPSQHDDVQAPSLQYAQWHMPSLHPGVLPKCRLGEEGALLARTAAYTLVQYVYEHMPAEVVKSSILGPAGGEQVRTY